MTSNRKIPILERPLPAFLDLPIDLIKDPVLPDWLNGAPDEPRQSSPTLASKDLLDLTYTALFEHTLEQIAGGMSLKGALEQDRRGIKYNSFLSWIHKDAQRKNRLYEAQAIGAEMVASEILTIADGDPERPPEDVQRSKLRIDSRFRLLGVWNRQRFGEVKQVEIAASISITEALAEAQGRMARIDRAEIIDDAVYTQIMDDDNNEQITDEDDV